ncbi:MAG: FeoA family protein [Verrucomicrobiota bacterium]|nr:FeoA family protein [Verrucomicrobiota bacterium]
MSHLARKLSELRPGETGVVSAFAAINAECLRLQEMGLLPGTEVRFLRKAPLGDPLEIELRGYCLTLRKKEADCVLIGASA